MTRFKAHFFDEFVFFIFFEFLVDRFRGLERGKIDEGLEVKRAKSIRDSQVNDDIVRRIQ